MQKRRRRNIFLEINFLFCIFCQNYIHYIIHQLIKMNVNTSNKWTRALWEPIAGIQTSKPCVALCDLHGKNDFQLVLVDESCLPNRLKLYKGLKTAVESVLADPPAAIIAFVCDSGNAGSTCLAVACGSSLLVYRNMKPYYRYNLPQKDILPTEIELWAQLKQNGGQQKEQLIDGLKHLQMEHSIGDLSYQAQQLLSFEGENGGGISSQQVAFIDFVLAKKSRDASATGGIGLQNVQVTCITIIPRNQSQTSADVLVIGTERGSIYFVDSQAYTVLQKNTIPAVPVKILAIGHFDLEYRVVICTREHDVFVLRKNGKGDFSTNSFYIREHPFDVVLCANQLVFATRRRRLIFFSLKCRRQNSMQFDEDIVDIEQFYYEPKQYSGILVVLANEIYLYMDQLRVDTIRMDRPIEWIRFGRMGREEGVLVIATQGGGLCVKIFRRVATFDDSRQALGQKKTAKSGIELPKKSRTFVDQSLRERQNPRQLHQIYQRDWFMVKWHTTKTFAELDGGKGGPMDLMMPNTKESEYLQIHYELLGFGPCFRLQMRILCTNKLDVQERWMMFVYNGQEYSFADRIIPLPRLVPNRQVSIRTQIRCLHPDKQLGEEEVRIVLCKMKWGRPIWTATFLMPISEPEIN